MNLPLKDITETVQQAPHKTWPLTGGVHPEENKHQSTSKPISKASIPAKLVLPLSQHAGAPAEAIVEVGDRVLKGQMVAKAIGFVSVPVHAPTSGVVTAIDDHSIPHPSGMNDTCITIETDGKDEWCELKPVEDYLAVEPSELVEHIRQSGIAGMGGAGFPTAVKLSPRSTIDTLILNGTECEPYITADDMLMRERADEIISGAAILMHLLKAKQCLIGIEDNKPEAVAAMKQATAGNPSMTVAVFPTKYPSGGEKQLIQILTGQEVPSGKLPSDLGIAVQNVGTAAAVHQAVNHGKPLISRVTTLTGDALGDKKNLEALLGTSVGELLKEADVNGRQLNTLVMGGPMMGFTLDDMTVPVVKTTNCLIAGSSQEFPSSIPEQACIRCGMCAEVCPSSLLPQQLYWHAKAENFDQLKHHNLFDCIECGACSFVCPSSIPLVQYYRASKGAIRTQEAKNAKAERSKVRYETRQARLEQEQAEKEAKRKANAKKAAALKAARENKDDTSSTAATAEVDPVKAAIERAKAKKAAGGASAPTKAALSSEQKELKIQLSLANAQLKKTQRALAQVEKSGEGDTAKLKSDVEMLQAQADKLQKEFDKASAAPAPEAAAKPAVSADLKKLKVESAMAKAALKKAERALATALEEGSSETDALKQAVEEQRIKAEELAKKLEATSAEQTPAAPAQKPSADDKKLKVENAMAKAALKKAERALAKAQEEGSDTAELQKTVDECRIKAEQMAAQLAAVSSEPAPAKAAPSKPAVDDKKLKVENAMAKAALKKAERALAKAQEEGADTAELQKTVDECRTKAEQMANQLAAASAPASEKPAAEKPVTEAKPAADDQLKKLKIENAMAKAAMKKAQRAVDNADGDTSALETALAEAKTKAEAAEKALAEHLA
ncbi:electron transport complex subunit RsxC [Endozoicomonas sp. OPT23]|uniref:electron transport complex subunit RsxC n=1 Tax=Endozoicomonas sp. OPT23 TaxID=2072845 RepID=UPI00129B438D|nr:electron transport complex subunit RsxC [Endozoicomonas sp. OPT23]MRI31984.1 electron transport complex subunit RsxC [Endozoicomonas sp. OPT23]